MLRNLVRAKVQRVTVTGKSLKYEGSLALDARLLRSAGILPSEVVQVVNVNSGARFETYTIEASTGSGECVLNGGAARLGEVGDELIIMSFCLLDEAEAKAHRLRVIRVDSKNRIKRDRHNPRRG